MFHRHNNIVYQWVIFIILNLILVSFSSALEFSATDIVLTGFDTSSHKVGFILLAENDRKDEQWLIADLITGKLIYSRNLQQLSLREGGTLSVYRTQAQTHFTELGIGTGTDVMVSHNQDQLLLPSGKLFFRESRGGFTVQLLWIGQLSKNIVVYNDDFSSLKEEMMQPPGYYLRGGKLSPDGRWLAIIIHYEIQTPPITQIEKLLLINTEALR